MNDAFDDDKDAVSLDRSVAVERASIRTQYKVAKTKKDIHPPSVLRWSGKGLCFFFPFSRLFAYNSVLEKRSSCLRFHYLFLRKILVRII